jgi:hypothetical protein
VFELGIERNIGEDICDLYEELLSFAICLMVRMKLRVISV